MTSLEERVARAVSMTLYGRDVIPNDISLPYGDSSPVGKCMAAARAAIAVCAEHFAEMATAHTKESDSFRKQCVEEKDRDGYLVHGASRDALGLLAADIRRAAAIRSMGERG